MNTHHQDLLMTSVRTEEIRWGVGGRNRDHDTDRQTDTPQK